MYETKASFAGRIGRQDDCMTTNPKHARVELRPHLDPPACVSGDVVLFSTTPEYNTLPDRQAAAYVFSSFFCSSVSWSSSLRNFLQRTRPLAHALSLAASHTTEEVCTAKFSLHVLHSCDEVLPPVRARSFVWCPSLGVPRSSAPLVQLTIGDRRVTCGTSRYTV